VKLLAILGTISWKPVLGSSRNRNKLLVAIRGVLRVHNCGSHGITESVSDIVIEVPKKLEEFK